MKKEEIVEKLLVKDHITFKEAVTLLEKEIVGIPQQPLFLPPHLPYKYPEIGPQIFYSKDTN